MAIIDKKQFLSNFAIKNINAKKVNFLWDSQYCEKILNANLGIINAVNIKAEFGAEWHEQFQLFLYKEFIEKPKFSSDSFYGRIKQTEFGQHKDNCLSSIIKKEPFENNILPLLNEFIEYKKQRVYYKEEANLTKTLIITALPLEFRSAVRRLDFIINIDKIEVK